MHIHEKTAENYVIAITDEHSDKGDKGSSQKN